MRVGNSGLFIYTSSSSNSSSSSSSRRRRRRRSSSSSNGSINYLTVLLVLYSTSNSRNLAEKTQGAQVGVGWGHFRPSLGFHLLMKFYQSHWPELAMGF